jgi:hypothetical protein
VPPYPLLSLLPGGRNPESPTARLAVTEAVEGSKETRGGGGGCAGTGEDVVARRSYSGGRGSDGSAVGGSLGQGSEVRGSAPAAGWVDGGPAGDGCEGGRRWFLIGGGEKGLDQSFHIFLLFLLHAFSFF